MHKWGITDEMREVVVTKFQAELLKWGTAFACNPTRNGRERANTEA